MRTRNGKGKTGSLAGGRPAPVQQAAVQPRPQQKPKPKPQPARNPNKPVQKKMTKQEFDQYELEKAINRREQPEMTATEFAKAMRTMQREDIPRIDQPAPAEPERVINPTRAQTSSLTKEVPKTPVKPRKRGRQLIFTILALILFIGVSVGGYFAWQKFKPVSMDDLRLDIVELYTDKNKVELKETTTMEVVTALRQELEAIDDKGNVQEKEGLLNEMTTIATFLTDNALLDEMADTGYDLLGAEFNTNIENLRASTNTYTIPGLNMTAIGKISSLCAEQRDIMNIMNELLTVSNSIDKSPAPYIDTIQEKVTHTPNKEALVNCISLIDEKQKGMRRLEDLKKDMKTNKEEIDELQTKMTDIQNQINAILTPETEDVVS